MFTDMHIGGYNPKYYWFDYYDPPPEATLYPRVVDETVFQGSPRSRQLVVPVKHHREKRAMGKRQKLARKKQRSK